MIYGIRENTYWANEVRPHQSCAQSTSFTTSDINAAYQYLAYLLITFPLFNYPSANHHVEERDP